MSTIHSTISPLREIMANGFADVFSMPVSMKLALDTLGGSPSARDCLTKMASREDCT